MQIKPMAQGTPAPAINEGQSASPERIARAKAVMNGQDPNVLPPDSNLDPGFQSVRHIKMRTNRTVDRGMPPEIDPQSNISDTNETSPQAQANEEIKPLSPQFAALAKAKRALQEERRALDAEKARIQASTQVHPGEYISKAELLASPLSVLQSNGLTYDQLTEAILSDQHQNSPALTKLELEIQALKQGLENQTKQQEEQANAQKKQVLMQMARDAARIVSIGDQFELVRETRSIPEVIEVIDKHFLDTGEVLELEDVLQETEKLLLEDNLKIARINKIKSQIVPVTEEIPQRQNYNNGGRGQMRTLTNRDGASAPSSARERAIAAFYGKKL